MSERVDRLLAAYEGLNAGNFDAVSAGLPPTFEFIPPGILPEAGGYHGPDGLRQLWETWSTSFDAFRVDIEETIEAGDSVIVMAAVAGRHRESGLEMSTPSFAWVWTFEGDTPVRLEAMPNRASAMESVGLGE